LALGGEPQGLLSAADRALGDVDAAIIHVRAMNLGLARPAGLPWKCAYFPMQNFVIGGKPRGCWGSGGWRG